MKINTFTPRTVEFFVGILATGLIAAGLMIYAFQEPVRIDVAGQAHLAANLEDAMTLYAENCSVCHGLSGEGIGATPALNRPELQAADPDSLEKIISRGLFNTAMPAWNKADGGPLSDYQVDELVALIQQGDWQATQERVVNLGLAPRVPFTAQPDPQILAELAGLPQGDVLSRGVVIYAEQCVACHGADGLGAALAPALNEPLVRAKDPAELERTVLNGVPATLMAAWQNKLPADDITAVVTLIKNWDQVPLGAIPAPDRPIPVTEESLAQGASLYTTSCSRCHGPEGQGTQRAPALNVKSFLSSRTDAAIQQIVTLGVTGTAMPAWGDRLTDVEIQAVVGFMRSWEPDAPEVATPLRGPWWRAGGSQAGSGPALPSGGSSGASTPPWSQAAQNQAVSQPLDWRKFLLVGAAGALALTLIGISILGLRRVEAEAGLVPPPAEV